MDCLNKTIRESIVTTINYIIKKCKDIGEYNTAKHLMDIDKLNKVPINNIKKKLNHKKDNRLEYTTDRRKFEFNYNWGQRKLLLTEIQFLTNYYNLFQDKPKYVIYVGAAHGIHIPLLSNFFPDINFILFDPRKFSISETPKIKIYNRIFTNEDAVHYKNNLTNYMFICDIRIRDIENVSDIEIVNKLINQDMKLQMDWHLILNPIKSHLKFRPPRDNIKFNYLAGLIFYQPWSGKHSLETRLVPFDNNMKEYDSKIYNEELFYHNRITRKNYYYTNYNINPKFFCHCYDCALEITILKNYNQNILNKKYKYKDIEKLSNYITNKLFNNKYKSIFDKKIKVNYYQ
jgi:hypothetical protein